MKNNDVEYLRVTDVLYPFSGLKEIDPEILKNAADRGTAVHKICESILLNFGKMDLDDLVNKYCRNPEHFIKEKEKVESFVKSFERWAENKKLEKNSTRFFDDDLMITGECDLIYKNDEGRLILVDLKTPASESKSWLLQGSAYSYLAKKSGINVEGIEFVQLSRTGGKAKIYQYEENFQLFKSVLDTYKYFYKERFSENLMDYL